MIVTAVAESCHHFLLKAFHALSFQRNRQIQSNRD
nr:MAG TPA: hypothetical protein [Caudoviricetes sp.]